jgi:hypothetical protein
MPTVANFATTPNVATTLIIAQNLKNGEANEKSNMQKMHIANATRASIFYGLETPKTGRTHL